MPRVLIVCLKFFPLRFTIHQQPCASSEEWLDAPDKYDLASGHCRLNQNSLQEVPRKFLIWRIFSFTIGNREVADIKWKT